MVNGAASADGGALSFKDARIMNILYNTFQVCSLCRISSHPLETCKACAATQAFLCGASSSGFPGLIHTLSKPGRLAAGSSCNCDAVCLQNNTAVRGGAISALTSQTSISGSKFINNSASAAGATGAALFSDGGQVTLGIGNIYTPLQAALAISK